MIKVYTSVVADLLHVGHLNFFRRAKELGDILIVGVLTDEAVESYKRKPIIPFEERFELVGAIKYVDKVVPQHERDGTENLKIYKPDILTRADDVILEEEVSYIKSIGGRFIQIPYTEGISTSQIIEKIRSRR